MADVSMRDALAFIKANAELFAGLVDENGEVNVEELETAAVRGDALKVLERKTTFSEEARETFLDAVFQIADDYAAGFKKDTKAANQFGFLTPSGYKIRVTLEKEGKQS